MKRNGHARIPSGLKDSLLFHLDAVLRIVNLRAEASLQETLELGLRESLIIQAASSDPPLSQGHMADCLGVNRNVMVLEIDRLEKKNGNGTGYVKRERLPANRREQVITLTAKGRRTAIAVEQRSAGVWTICDGKVIDIRAYASFPAALQAVGLIA